MKTATNNKRRSTKSTSVSVDPGVLLRRKRIANEVRLFIEDKRISRPQLERLVNRSRSTIDHFFTGRFSETLLARIEHVLNRKFGQSSSVAPTEWGGYTQEATAQLVGSYLTLRNDFRDPSRIFAYVTTIEWGNIDHAHTFEGQLIQKPKIEGYGLIFREERRADSKFTHRGQVWLPGGQYLYLVTAYGDGRLRAAIVSVPNKGRMTGIQLSQYNPKGAAYTPAAAPIALLRRDKIADQELGYLLPDAPYYSEYKKALCDAMDDVVFALPQSPP